ncbi:extracellular solute-binding protein [Halorussus halobius]|uniref:extracellular solute-binding protein n=1 Tax=Halorussus halobius TaxID=1710537 RepID=UPI0034A22D96
MEAAGASGVAVGLTGYAGEVDAQGTTTVQWATDQLASDNSDAIQQALYDAGLSQDIEIDFLAGAWGGGRQDQYQQWLSSGRERPDLFMMDTGWTIPFIYRDQVVDLSQRLPEETISRIEGDYFEAHVETARGPEGNLHGVPLFIDLPTMQYRRDLVEDAGYDPEGNNWATESMTWQRFSEIVADVLEQNADDVDYGFTFQAQSYNGLPCCTFNEFMTSWGGAYFGDPTQNLFGPVGDRPVTVNEQPVLDAIRMVRTFIHGTEAENTLGDYADISPSGVLQWDEEPSRRPFTTGNAVAHRNWPYSINQSGSDENLGDALGVMPIPYAVTEDEAQYPGTGGPVAALGGWHMTMNPNSTKQEAALEVLDAMMADSFRLALFEIVGWIPPAPDLLETDQAQQVPVMGDYLTPIRVAGENAISRPVTPVWPQESQRIAQQVNSALSEGGTPEQAMSQLEGQLQQIEESAN